MPKPNLEQGFGIHYDTEVYQGQQLEMVLQ